MARKATEESQETQPEYNPNAIPPWVSGYNERGQGGSVRKYLRAVQVLKKAGSEINEDAIKELYIKYGGLIVEKQPAAE